MILYNKYNSVRKLPVNFVKSDLCLFEHELNKEVGPSHLIQLRDVNINSNCVIFKNGLPIQDEKVNPLILKDFNSLKSKLAFYIRNYIIKKKITIKTDAIWATDIWSNNYFHWLTDAFPRLISIKNLLKGRTVLLPFYYREYDYVTRSLSLFKDINIIFIRDEEVVHCKKLFIPSQSGEGGGNYNEKIIQDTRNFFRSSFKDIQPEIIYDKIYISRANSAYRKVVNERDLIRLLQEYGFEIMHFEEYDWQKQVGMAMRCNYLISPHGAGLANMIFMN